MWICSSRSAPTSVRAMNLPRSTHTRARRVGGEGGRGGLRIASLRVVRSVVGGVGGDDDFGGFDDGQGARALLELEAFGGAGADEGDDAMAAADVDGDFGHD